MFIQLFIGALRAQSVSENEITGEEWPHRTEHGLNFEYLFILDCKRTTVKYFLAYFLFIPFFQSSPVRVCVCWLCLRIPMWMRCSSTDFIWSISICVANFIIWLIQTLQFASQRQCKCAVPSPPVKIRFSSVSVPVASNSMGNCWAGFILFRSQNANHNVRQNEINNGLSSLM